VVTPPSLKRRIRGDCHHALTSMVHTKMKTMHTTTATTTNKKMSTARLAKASQ
jgi:hypothetical protein